MYNLKYIPESGNEIILTYDYGYLIKTVEGATGRAVNLNTTQGYEQIGETVQSTSLGGQIITVYGTIPRRNTSAKLALLRAFLPLTKGRLVWEDRYFMDVYVKDSPTVTQEKHSDFILSLFASYPYWQKLSENYYELGGLSGGFRFPVNYATPHRFATYSSETQFNAVNNGDSAANFTLNITSGGADLVNFAVTNIKTLKFIRFTGTLPAETKLEMYRDGGQLYIKAGGADAFDLIDDTSDLFSLDPGDNVLLFTADSGAAEAKIAITFNETFAGVLADGV